MKDDDDIDALKAEHKHVGTIRILVKRAKGGRDKPWANNNARTCQQQQQIVHKVFKGDARSVSARYASTYLAMSADILKASRKDLCYATALSSPT
jgi:hypothetical protein